VSASRATPASMDHVTTRIEAALIARIGPQRYYLWFQHTAFVPMGRELLLAVPTEHTQEWLARTFGDAIRSAVEEAFGTPLPVKFVVDPGLFDPPAPEPKPTSAEKPKDKNHGPQLDLFGEPQHKALPPKPQRDADRRKNPPRRFRSLADFVVGPCNRVAHASAVNVVEEPGLGGSCLLLYGPVGTGKTHLLEGIYAGLRKTSPDLQLAFVTAEDFTTRFVQSSRFRKQSAFRRYFRDCGVLLLDDLHFLVGKKMTQEEFLYTFDALASDGRQIVVTMDCHPRHAEELMPELVDRLLGGAIWSLMPPDDETRLEILRKKATGANPPLPDDVLQFVGKNLKGNVRELEGAVNGLKHYAKVTGKPLTTSAAREALGDLLRHTVRAVTLADIDAAVRTVLHLSAGALQSKARSWAVSRPRMLAIYLARKHTTATYNDIAKYFAVKTHSTPVAAEKKVREWIGKDETLALGDREWRTKDLLERIERELQR